MVKRLHLSSGAYALSFLLLLSFVVSCTKEKIRTDPTDEPKTPPSDLAERFLYGSNMGAYQGWSDEQLAELLMGNTAKGIAGVGVNSLRPAMYDHFVQQWGYDIRLNAFETYQQLGGTDHTVFLNGPTDAHREQASYCNGIRSQTFANLYEPIWSSAGKVNDNNYYASYVYNVVKTYGPYVKYWEVWNEPDYTNNWEATQTWAQTDPNPCDLPNFAAPIQSYVRMLRITYEIVKHLDGDGLVCVGGLGYPSFLEAILRNTDNPNGGSVSADYPKKGGEWFDCLSYHVYPMYYLGSNHNSDAAATALVNHKNAFQAVLDNYSYDGTTNPKKAFIITESNIPRKSIDGYIGGDVVQRNFLIKAAVQAQKAGISALYIYGPAESRPLAQANDPYQAMGFYQNITSGPYHATITSGGIAWRTVSGLLRTRQYDPAATAMLQLPGHIDGAAFYGADDESYVYVLWAKTSEASETASAQYSFPASLKMTTATQFDWDNQQTRVTSTLALTGSPVFIKP
ncbi:hypothetical protein JHJ32_00500 [Parapedobacter sp. ISTM3]|uniref:hypothetical protein n=1 Tax=Parapedobacter sp. ISTM3 TaxID=2800130 RepID=UPI0019087086|nr:hypothetical protein [Parapedobacter sp. ISTM3]MBK1438451.1 hypothetical protein [Parapedobacter sp. ISTM3]